MTTTTAVQQQTPTPPTPSSRRPSSRFFPFRANKSADELASASSSDCEVSPRSRAASFFFKNHSERAQLICCKDNTKYLGVKGGEYRTFDEQQQQLSVKKKKGGKRAAILTKFQSLDVAEPPKPRPKSHSLVKYYDKSSKVTISAQDFYDPDYRLTKYDKRPSTLGLRRPKHSDIISDTVDAWADKKGGGRGVFANLKNSLFSRSNSNENGGKAEVVFKPLVFGGTFPIDAPTGERPPSVGGRADAKGGQGMPRVTLDPNFGLVRNYGPAKSFDIDLPI